MLELAIKGGTMKITDDNKTIVSQNIAAEIDENLIAADVGELKKPVITVIEDKKSAT